MDVYTTPGAFSWSELMTPDPAAAREFYGALFGWKFDVMNMGQGDYHVVKADGTAVGGPPAASVCAPWPFVSR